MTTNNDAETLIRLAITKNSEPPDEIALRLGEQTAYGLMSAALAVAANRRFPAGTGLTEISTYATRLRERFSDVAEQLKPTVVEAIIRAARGEDDRLDGLDPTEVTSLLFILTYAMATEEDMNDAEKDAFVDEVFALAEADSDADSEEDSCR